MSGSDGGGDHYSVLGVSKDGSADDIKRAFRKRARECHPDVRGDDPSATEEFKRVKAAYDVLSDPQTRAEYDRAREGARWRSAGPSGRPGYAARAAADASRGRSDLDDLFAAGDGRVPSDFGFGAGEHRRAPIPIPGRDVAVAVDVPAATAEAGGSVPVSWTRLRRLDGSEVLGRFEDLHELRVPPGTRTGDTLRVPRLGDMGQHGGAPGDLVVDVRVVGVAREPGAHGPVAPVREVDISIAEAVLGGRIPVETTAGPVVVTIPAGTSSGTRFRIRGRGFGGADLEVAVRIVVPTALDEESRKLIARFAQLNPVR